MFLRRQIIYLSRDKTVPAPIRESVVSTIIMPIPSRDFDPTEVAVSWKVLVGRGHLVRFATPDGRPGSCDPIMIDGIGLDPWSRLPGLRRLRVIGLILRANKDARQAYDELTGDAQFRAPLRWDALAESDFDGLLLAGGHRARGMREYLESSELQSLVAAFFAADKLVAAICHGVLLAARSKRRDGLSVLHGRKTTSLTWAQERAASAFARFGRWWDRDYYRTYKEKPGEPKGTMSVQAEVTRALAAPDDFIDVPVSDSAFRKKTGGLSRDTATDGSAAWVVTDGNYVSARWPGDAHSLAAKFDQLLRDFSTKAANLR